MLLHGLLRPEGGLYITIISTSIALDINSTLMTPWFPRDEAQDNDYDDPRDDDYDDHRHAHDQWSLTIVMMMMNLISPLHVQLSVGAGLPVTTPLTAIVHVITVIIIVISSSSL